MKKFFMKTALVAVLGLSMVSCKVSHQLTPYCEA